MKHTTDLKPQLFHIPPNLVTDYLLANGWVLDKVVDNYKIFSLEHGESGCKLLLPQNPFGEEYQHRLLDILLVLQLTRSPSIGDIANEIKQFRSK